MSCLLSLYISFPFSVCLVFLLCVSHMRSLYISSPFSVCLISLLCMSHVCSLFLLCMSHLRPRAMASYSTLHSVICVRLCSWIPFLSSVFPWHHSPLTSFARGFSLL